MDIKLYPGLEAWLKTQKYPDALVCKLLTEYRHGLGSTAAPYVIAFCILVSGLMLGYSWCMYHRPLVTQAPIVYYHPDIAIDLTKDMPATPGGNRYNK